MNMTTNIGLGFEIDKFHKFWWIRVFRRIYSGNRLSGPIRRANHDHPRWNRLKGPLIHYPRQTTTNQVEWGLCGASRPGPPLGLCFEGRCSTTSKGQSSPWIKVDSNRASKWSVARIHGLTGCLVPPTKGPPTSSRRPSPISREIHQRSI